MSFFKYLQESAAEVKHISWPTSKQAGQYTLLVVIISLFAAAYIGVFDRIFTSVVDFALNGSDSNVVVTPHESTGENPVEVEVTSENDIIDSVSVELNTEGETEVEAN